MDNFNDLLEEYLQTTENHAHFKVVTELAIDATGFPNVDEVVNSDYLQDFLDYDVNHLEEYDNLYDYDNFLQQNAREKFVQELDIHMTSTNLQSYQDFQEMYNDFVEITGYEGTEEEFARSLKRSDVFFAFLMGITGSTSEDF